MSESSQPSLSTWHSALLSPNVWVAGGYASRESLISQADSLLARDLIDPVEHQHLLDKVSLADQVASRGPADSVFGDDFSGNVSQLKTYRKGETEESILEKILEMAINQDRQPEEVARFCVSSIEAGRPLPWEFTD